MSLTKCEKPLTEPSWQPIPEFRGWWQRCCNLPKRHRGDCHLSHGEWRKVGDKRTDFTWNAEAGRYERAGSEKGLEQ